jgi:glutathionyl-hydroquinone reductase
MGMLIEGVWEPDDAAARVGPRGEFVRTQTTFRGTISKERGAMYFPEANRYHLYVSDACPWSHRTAITVVVKGLADFISLSSVAPQVGTNGWTFAEFADGDHDPIYGADHLHQIYSAVQANYTGRVTVPVLFDKKTRTIVNNESTEIMRILNSVFNSMARHPEVDLYPRALHEDINSLNNLIYSTVNNGVYRAGFAITQEQYQEAVIGLFDTLDLLERRLAGKRYLCGDCLTEADWRLFVTLIRFDPVYYSHFKCNVRRIVDYPNLSGYLRDLYQFPGIASTVNFEHIKNHYYRSHPTLNPTGIVPVGPDFSLLDTPHERQSLRHSSSA